MAKFAIVFCFTCFMGSIYGMGLDLEPIDEDSQSEDDRTIIVAAGTNNILGFNLTQLLPLLALASAALLPLLCLCALAGLLLWTLLDDNDSGYGQSTGYGSSYSQYKRSLGIDTFDWEKLRIIDWVAMGEETFRKFEPSNLSCQTRLVCELHQNSKQFGKLGSNVVHAFGYLHYLEVFNLPEIFKGLISEYLNAADRGRSLKKDCGDIYPECDFSIKQIYDRYLINEIQ